MRKYLLIILSCFGMQNLWASFDTCTLKASFYPAKDTLVVANFSAVFNNTTIGATDLTWYVNGEAYSPFPSFNYSTAKPGVNEISLAVSNGACVDTARMYVVVTGVPPSTHDYYKLGISVNGNECLGYAVARINAEEYVMGGYINYSGSTGLRKKAFLTVLNDDGCIRWSKQIADTVDHNVTQLKKAANGDILVGYDSYYIMRIDANGNQKWTRTLPDYLTVKRAFTDFMEDADGNILIFYSGFFVGATNQAIVKMDANGNTIWARYYAVGDKQIVLPRSIVQLNGSYYFCGQFNTRVNSLGQYLNQSFLSRINMITGATQWAKLYTGASFISMMDLYVFNNQLLVGSGGLGNQNAAMIYLDTIGNFQKMYNLNFVLDPSIGFTGTFLDYARIVPLTNGDILSYTRTPVAFFDSIQYHEDCSLLRIHNGNQIVWEKNLVSPLTGIDFTNWYIAVTEGKNESVIGTGHIANGSENGSAALMKISGTGDRTTECYEGPLLRHTITEGLLTVAPLSWVSETGFNSPMVDRRLVFENISAQRTWFCPQSIDSCSLLKIEGPNLICDTGRDYTYRIHKSGNCSNSIHVSDGVHIKLLTDSSLLVSFTQKGNQKIKLSLTGVCVPLEDSINITVGAIASALISGTTICSADSVVFKLPVGYSDFTISPKIFLTSVTPSQIIAQPQSSTTYVLNLRKNNSCGVLDTVAVTVFPVNAIQLGNDTSLCKGQSLTLNVANPAYTRYQWSTGNSSSQITVSDKGSYWLHATDKNGCKYADTLQVKEIKTLPTISLTSEPAVCAGKTVILNAPLGMKKVIWQDGSLNTSFPVTQSGKYWVTVTDNFQCSNSDTVTLHVIPAPGRFLTTDSAICRFDTITLRSSIVFDKYLWSDGTTLPTLIAGTAGMYSLTGTDRYHCEWTQKMFTTVQDCSYSIFFPTAFTPNGDGLNDVFRPKAYGHLQFFHMDIYNRWGQKIISTNDYIRGWDGNINKTPQNKDTYVWIATYRFPGQASKTEKGIVVLIR